MSDDGANPPGSKRPPVRVWCATGLAVALWACDYIVALPWIEVQRQGVDIPSFPAGFCWLDSLALAVTIVAGVWWLTWRFDRRAS